MKATISERFWAKVNRTDTCWLWTAGLTADGYGQFAEHHISQRAHRIAYEMLVGPIPKGLTVDHLCRIRSCQNPDHMELVPPGVNALRGNGPAALNARKTHCGNGHSFDTANTYRSREGRACRPCRATSNRAYRLRKKERVLA